jgi:hypothetical protein
MKIEFTKKPVYTFAGTDYPTLAEAQIAAIGSLDPKFAMPGMVDPMAVTILAYATELTAIFNFSAVLQQTKTG